jgi:hypothetical protein
MNTCFVTIHGVGFQKEGYAESLQEQLTVALGDRIRQDVVYITGNWPPNDPGLDKLGTWNNADHRTIMNGEPLFGAGPIVHVALVYSNTEGGGQAVLVALEAAAEPD